MTLCFNAGTNLHLSRVPRLKMPDENLKALLHKPMGSQQFHTIIITGVIKNKIWQFRVQASPPKKFMGTIKRIEQHSATTCSLVEGFLCHSLSSKFSRKPRGSKIRRSCEQAVSPSHPLSSHSFTTNCQEQFKVFPLEFVNNSPRLSR